MGGKLEEGKLQLSLRFWNPHRILVSGCGDDSLPIWQAGLSRDTKAHEEFDRPGCCAREEQSSTLKEVGFAQPTSTWKRYEITVRSLRFLRGRFFAIVTF